MKLSIVTTLYRSAPYLPDFYDRCCAAAEGITDDFEIVLVNDGSPDDSLDVALELHERDRRVRVVDLARNFGQHKAILTGLAHARGDLVFSLDSDLEEDPDWLGPFHERMKETGADVVYGVQEKRKGKLFERMSGTVFYAIFRLLSSYPVPPNQVSARLMTRRYVESLIEHKDQEVFLAGLWAITGYEQVSVPVEKADKGSSTYSLRMKFSFALTSITAFSNVPPVLVFYLGMLVTAVSVSAALIAFFCQGVLHRLRARLALAHHLHLVPQWAHLLVSRRHRHVPLEDLHGDQGSALHDHPAVLRSPGGDSPGAGSHRG